MNWRDSLRIALHGIAANRLRSALTVLGILIGVAAVIMLVAVGTGSSQSVQDQITSLGTNTLTITQRPSFFGGGSSGAQVQLTMDDVKSIQDDFNAPDVKLVAPTVSAQGTAAAYQGVTYSPAQTTGTTSDYFKIRNFEPATGTLFTKQDEKDHRQVVVIGQTVVDNLFFGQNPIGAQIKLGDDTWEVIGVTKKKGSNGFQDQDDVVFAPITAVRDNLTGNSRNINGISVQAESRETIDAAQAQVESVLNTNHDVTTGTSGFLVQNQDSLLDTSDETSGVFTTLLGAVAAISLLVGGIGVMNIMLVTVTERTREIGIRKAVGATHGAILIQFLFEAVLLSIVGGFLGVGAGLIGSEFEVVGIQPVVATYSIPLAFGVAVAVGLFFGIYPANRAASLRPIEALRHE